MRNIEKINFLLDKVEAKKTAPSFRKKNLKELQGLVEHLKLNEKHTDFKTLFNYTAMNLAGIGLKDENFGKIREGKYVQIIAITYEVNNDGNKVTKNSSLGYYGKAELLKEKEKNNIIEFILRWRYEKTFQHSDYYQQLLQKLH